MITPIRTLSLILAAITLVMAVPVTPAEAEQPRRDDRWAVEGGIGFTADPELFGITTAFPYGITDQLLFVPTVQWAVGDNQAIIAPSATFRWLFPMTGARNEEVRKLAPFAEGGVGFAWVDRGGDDVGFLLELGGGVDYAIDDDVSLISTMRFNILPDDSANETFFYHWQVLGAQYRF